MSGAEALTERLTGAERDRSHPPVRVRDAATLIVYDAKSHSVLMGRRSMAHVFMPGRTVFPGGRVDRADARVRVAEDYPPHVAKRLGAATNARTGAARLRAFGVAAVREAYEEAGILVGKEAAGTALPAGETWRPFAERGIAVSLKEMRFVARAVTPPGRPRRFDTRFLLVPRECVAAVDPSVLGPEAELEEVSYVPIAEAKRLDLPTITLTVLDELEAQLGPDGLPAPDRPVPYYRWRPKGFVRELL